MALCVWCIYAAKLTPHLQRLDNAPNWVIAAILAALSAVSR